MEEFMWKGGNSTSQDKDELMVFSEANKNLS